MADVFEVLADIDERRDNLVELSKRFPDARQGDWGWEAEGAEKFADTIEIRDGSLYAYFKIGDVRVYGRFPGRIGNLTLDRLKASHPTAFQALLETITGVNR